MLKFIEILTIPAGHAQRTTSGYTLGQLILLRYNLKNSWCYSTISASWTLAWSLECLSVSKLKSAIHTIIRLYMYSFFLMFDCFFYESQMMVYIFFQDTN